MHGAGSDLVFVGTLAVLLDGFLHCDLLRVPLFGVQLRLKADELLGDRRALVGLARLLLALLLFIVEAATEPVTRARRERRKRVSERDDWGEKRARVKEEV